MWTVKIGGHWTGENYPGFLLLVVKLSVRYRLFGIGLDKTISSAWLPESRLIRNKQRELKLLRRYMFEICSVHVIFY